MATNNVVFSDSIENKIVSVGDNPKLSDEEDKKFKIKAGLFLTGVTAVSAMFGFSATVSAVKKREPEFFKQGIVGTQGLAETGASLATRALGWGTLYAITGCSVLFYGIWKLSGASNFVEFRQKMGEILPRIPKHENQGRSEFEDIHDFLSYINLSSRTKKSQKSEET